MEIHSRLDGPSHVLQANHLPRRPQKWQSRRRRLSRKALANMANCRSQFPMKSHSLKFCWRRRILGGCEANFFICQTKNASLRVESEKKVGSFQIGCESYRIILQVKKPLDTDRRQTIEKARVIKKIHFELHFPLSNHHHAVFVCRRPPISACQYHLQSRNEIKIS
jgi:hypothetical protein